MPDPFCYTCLLTCTWHSEASTLILIFDFLDCSKPLPNIPGSPTVFSYGNFAIGNGFVLPYDEVYFISLKSDCKIPFRTGRKIAVA